MSIIFNVIIILSIIQIISCVCGIPGVPAFARIVDFNPKMTKYPEGYQLTYDCIDPNGLNINGNPKRVCKGNQWIPRQIPICDIADPDDAKSEFQLEILDSNDTTLKKSSFHNNWSLFGTQVSYAENLRNNFIIHASNQSNLWRIKFANKYPVEIDHSFLVIMVFVIPHNSTHNNSDINIDIKSKLTSTQRTCRTKTEIDSIDKLFRGFNTTAFISNNTWEKDVFHKILMECRNNWMDRPFRWQKTSALESLTGINLTLKIDSLSPIELILTQLTVDVDCGYPDIPINGNYSKSWMNAIISCDSGQLFGDNNVSCLYNGRWDDSKIEPKCCVGNECEIGKQNKQNITATELLLILLSSAVVILVILVITLFIRSKKKQKIQAIQCNKSIDNDYDDIDLNGDQTYDHIQQPDYDSNYDQINYHQLELYDDNQGINDRRMSMKVIKDMEGEYVQMDKCDAYVTMKSKSVSNASVTANSKFYVSVQTD